ncbi:MAG: metalloregulator ArsR/SmtB family transcription factor [Planctomycetota bacterium]
METCIPKPSLQARPLVGEEAAERLGTLFKCLSHPTRLRLLHALIRAGKMRVTDLANETEMSTQAISNQLQRLAELGIVHGTRNGLNVSYRVVDPCVPVLIERGWCHIEEYDAAAAAASA